VISVSQWHHFLGHTVVDIFISAGSAEGANRVLAANIDYPTRQKLVISVYVVNF